MGFAFRRKDVHEVFDVTFEILAEYYEWYISEFWDKPLIFGGMKPVSSTYEELMFRKADDASKAAVSLFLEMLKDTSAHPIPAWHVGQDKPDETEYASREDKHGFSVLFAGAVIGLSIGAAILGVKLAKNMKPNNEPVHENPAQLIISQDNEKVSTDHN